MPPPRLSRHLRPCHLPVTAKQVRCVHTTGRAKLSTTGYDTTPQTPSAKGSNAEGSALSDPTDSKNDVPAKEKPWWKRALARVAPFGKHGEQFESIESKSGQSSPHIDQPERLATSLQETGRESEREGQGSTQLAASSTTSQQDKEAQPGQMRLADWRKDDLASSGQDDMAAMRQQIHQLSEQLRALEARLGTGSPTGQSPSTSAGVSRTLAIRPEATQFDMDSQDLAYPTQTSSHFLLTDKLLSAKRDLIRKRANSIYAGAVGRYGQAAALLARSPARLVAPVAPSILRHFRAIRGIALMDDDMNSMQTFFKYKPTIDLLESILRKSSVPVPSLSDPIVADNVAKYSKALCYDNLISHTLDTCRKRYSRSFAKFNEAVKELDRLRSPMVAPIVTRARGQLLIMGADLYEEEDKVLIDLAEAHRMKEGGPWRRKTLAPTEPSVLVPKPTDTREKHIRNDIAENEDNGQRLMHQIQTQWQSRTSSTDLRTNSKDHGLETSAPEQRPNIKESTSSNSLSNAEASTAAQTAKSSEPPLRTDEVSEQSLLEELFPETNLIPQPQPTKKNRNQYPRLELPKSTVRPVFAKTPRTPAQQAAEKISQHGEQISVLQLTNCSTGLTEADFRRIIPKGKHLEGWRQDSDFYKVIPGRDALSLERLPFYYLLFRNTEAALSYQKNASRLHKLSARYQPSSILSAIPPPKGFLEDGEDIAAAVASYNLLPKNHSLSLNVVMQPYNPALRQLIHRGGYQPIVTSADDKKKNICRVLLHIEGWEPSPSDLFAAITRDAYRQGMLHPLRNESQSSIHRLRDIINLKISSKTISSSRPRQYGTFDHSGKSTLASELVYDDPEIQSMMGGIDEDRSQAQMNQEVMNRVYNRWILDFEDVDTARRWSLRWHRRPLHEMTSGESTWKDDEEARICNTEVLW